MRASPTPRLRIIAAAGVLLVTALISSAAAIGRAGTTAADWTVNGPDGVQGTAIAIDPAHPQTVYIGAGGDGIWLTHDAGQSWQRLTGPRLDIDQIALDPRRERTIYVVTRWSRGSRVFKSTDSGLSWAWSGRGLHGREVTSLAVSPAHEGVVYASTPVGLYKTINGGGSWHPNHTYLPNASVAFDLQRPGTVFAGTTHGVYRSRDGGYSWTLLTTFGTDQPHVSALASDPSSPNILIASSWVGTFRSTDSGASWSPIASSIYGLSEIDFASNNFQVVYGAYGANAPNIIERSTDAGLHWVATPISGNPPTESINGLAVTPRGSRAYAATDGIYARLPDGTWVETDAGITASYINWVAADSGDPSEVLASVFGSGLWESTDAGGSWSSLTEAPQIDVVAVAPSDSSVLYGESGGRLYRSKDGGATWKFRSKGLWINSIVVDPNDAHTIYVGISKSGVYRSTDGGRTLTQLAPFGYKHFVDQLAIDPADPSRLFVAAGREGAFESDDGGASWRQIGSGALPNPREIAVRPGTSTIYIGTVGSGVWVTHDDGATWTQGEGVDGRSYGSPAYPGVRAIIIDPVSPSTAFAATAAHGVYRSDDNGSTWVPFDDGLVSPYLTSLTIAPDGSALHAGTRGAGVFDTPL